MDVEKYNSLFSKKEIKEVAEPLRRKSNLKDNLLNVPKIVVAINSIEREFHPIKNILESLSFKPELYEPEPSALLDFEQFSLNSPSAHLVDAGTGSNAGIESKQLNQSDNDFKFSELLNMPNGKDDWFEVIDAMTKDYYLELNNLMPTKAQAWVRLCENPPTGYGITASKDNLSITMIGIVKPFNKRSFDRRWAKYTAKSNQI